MAAASFVDGVLATVAMKPAAITKPDNNLIALLEYTGTITAPPGVTNVQATGFDFRPFISWSSAQTLASVPAFWARPNLFPLTAVTDVLSILTGFLSQPAYTPAGGITPLLCGFAAEPVVAIGTGTVTEVVGFNFRSVLGTSVAVGAGGIAAKVCGLRMGNASGAGTVSELVGADLDNLTKGATNLSLRSAGAAVEMRHAGPVRIGSSAAGPTGGSILHVDGGLTYKRRGIADIADTVLLTDLIVEYTSLTANRILTLPAAATAGAGKYYIVKKATNNVNSVIVTPSGGELIDGAANLTISAAWGSARIYSTGTAWMSA